MIIMDKNKLFSQSHLTAEGHFLLMEVERDYKFGYINHKTYVQMTREIRNTYIELSEKIYRAILEANPCRSNRRVNYNGKKGQVNRQGDPIW